MNQGTQASPRYSRFTVGRCFVRHENVRTGSYTGGMAAYWPPPVSLLVDTFLSHLGTLSEWESPFLQKGPKDTRMVNDFCHSDKTERF